MQKQIRQKKTKHVNLVPSREAISFMMSELIRAMQYALTDERGRIVALVNPDKMRIVH
jgi:hypothetical protein